MASDVQVLKWSALAKIGEFKKLYYPRPMIKAACTYMAASKGERTWLDMAASRGERTWLDIRDMI